MRNKVRYEWLLIVISNTSKQDFLTCVGTSRFIGVDSNLHPAMLLQLCRCTCFSGAAWFSSRILWKIFQRNQAKIIKVAWIHGKIIIINVTSLTIWYVHIKTRTFTAERLAPSCGKDPFTAHQRHQAVSSGVYCLFFSFLLFSVISFCTVCHRCCLLLSDY